MNRKPLLKPLNINTLVKALLIMFPIAALNAAITYPETKAGDTVDDYHGTLVPDPYRWLEDDNSAETKAWVAAQNKVTEAYLSKIPQRDQIAQRLRELWNYERIGHPQRYGEKVFFAYNSGLQNQYVLKVANSPDEEGKVLLDPNTFSPDGTTSLAGYAPSEDGKLLAYSISKSGSDWEEIHLRDVTTGKDLSDHLKWIKFSGISWKKDGSVGGFDGRKDDTTTYYSFTSFTQPGAIYRLNLATGKSTIWRRSETKFDSDAYETKQVFVTSKDGTKIPMFIVHKKGLTPSNATKTLLYGYGGFSISLTPGFSVTRAAWLERGGIFALANLRGGGEYGREWHLAGTRLQKQNVFDDFIACAEWLQKEGYTSKQKLAIQGGSNGGLLVGACMTQRPELFGAALPSVGVMDMLRFHQFTIGWAWEKDYGSADNPEEFKALHAYSPLHNLKPGTRYPATLVSTADHDDRVVPAHSFKFAARLQKCQAPDGPPVLIRIATSAGHGAGTALDKVIEKAADEIAFLEANLK